MHLQINKLSKRFGAAMTLDSVDPAVDDVPQLTGVIGASGPSASA